MDKNVHSNSQNNNKPRGGFGGPGDDKRGIRRTFSPGEGQQQYDYEVLGVARVVRVVKGGRRFSFRASVIVGDRSGKVGMGVGKSRDVQTAINKAYDNGVRHMLPVQLRDGTIVHEVRAKFGGAKVMLRPAKPGTGIIAGGTVRLVADLAGVRDLVSKRLGSANKVNTARATLKALGSLYVVEKKVKQVKAKAR